MRPGLRPAGRAPGGGSCEDTMCLSRDSSGLVTPCPPHRAMAEPPSVVAGGSSKVPAIDDSRRCLAGTRDATVDFGPGNPAIGLPGHLLSGTYFPTCLRYGLRDAECWSPRGAGHVVRPPGPGPRPRSRLPRGPATRPITMPAYENFLKSHWFLTGHPTSKNNFVLSQNLKTSPTQSHSEAISTTL